MVTDRFPFSFRSLNLLLRSALHEMHIAIVMNSASGVRTLRSDLIRFLKTHGHRITVVCALDAPSSSICQMGVGFAHWCVSRRGTNPILESLSIVRLRRILHNLRADIILSFTPKAVLYSSIASRFLSNGILFGIFTGLGFLFDRRYPLLTIVSPLVHLFLRLSLRTNTIVFFQNPDDQSLFVSKHILPAHRTRRVYGSGVDTSRFTPTATRYNSTHTVFLMIARMIVPKGVLDYIRAALILRREGCPAQVMLLGPFDDHPAAINPETVYSFQQSGIIRYLGYTNDVRPYLDEADVFVLPSYYREGTPRASLEAMAMAKPIITTDSPGCRETVIDNRNGYLVPVRDPVKLAAAMRRLVGNQSMIQKMGVESRKMVAASYDVGTVNRTLWNMIIDSYNKEQRAS